MEKFEKIVEKKLNEFNSKTTNNNVLEFAKCIIDIYESIQNVETINVDKIKENLLTKSLIKEEDIEFKKIKNHFAYIYCSNLENEAIIRSYDMYKTMEIIDYDTSFSINNTISSTNVDFFVYIDEKTSINKLVEQLKLLKNSNEMLFEIMFHCIVKNKEMIIEKILKLKYSFNNEIKEIVSKFLESNYNIKIEE